MEILELHNGDKYLIDKNRKIYEPEPDAYVDAWCEDCGDCAAVELPDGEGLCCCSCGASLSNDRDMT